MTLDWSYLRINLIQIGLSYDIVAWIMGCITSPSFVVLINGVPIEFFKGSIGIPQVFHISPYLFSFAIEGISLLICR